MARSSREIVVEGAVELPWARARQSARLNSGMKSRIAEAVLREGDPVRLQDLGIIRVMVRVRGWPGDWTCRSFSGELGGQECPPHIG
jgi:hypothetical protein